MIQANELRIGNWIEIYDTPPQFPEEKGLWRCNGMTIHLIESENDIKAKGIPLTEEILLKCGFVNYSTDKSNVFRLDGFLITYVNEGRFKGKRYLKFHSVTFEDFGHIQYLHQLQNLYFALTGNELEIRL